jgi:hypothetical protein
MFSAFAQVGRQLGVLAAQVHLSIAGSLGCLFSHRLGVILFFLTIESLVNKESPQPPGYGLLSLLVDKNHWLIDIGE